MCYPIPPYLHQKLAKRKKLRKKKIAHSKPLQNQLVPGVEKKGGITK